MLVGYACLTSPDGNVQEQMDALGFAGCDKIYAEEGSGAGDRPELKAATSYLRKGDTLVVLRLDCLTRSLKQLVRMMAGLDQKDISFLAITEDIDTRLANGKVAAKVFSGLAQFDRVTSKGSRKSRRVRIPPKKRPGRRPMLSEDAIKSIRVILDTNDVTVPQLAAQIGLSAGTLYRYLRK